MMALRDVIAKLGYEVDAGSEEKIKGSLGGVLKMAAGIAAAFGAAAFVGVNRMIQQTATLGDNIAKTSKQLGVNAQRLQELRFAANLAGAANEDVTTGLRRLQASAKEAGDGTKSYVDDFKTLGVTVRDSNGELKSAEQLLLDVADGMAGLSTDTERTALAQTLLGRSGTKLIPLLKGGSEAIKEQASRARELGEVFDEQLLAQSEDYIDAQRELEGAMQGLRNLIVQKLIPIWIRLTRGAADLAAKYRGPLKRAIDVVFRALSPLGRALEFLAERIKIILPLLGIVAAVLFPIPALLLLVGAAALLVAEDLEVMAEGGESAIGRLIDAFKEWGAETLGISDETFGKIWEWLKIIGEAIVTSFTDPITRLPELIDAVKNSLQPVVDLFNLLKKAEAQSFVLEHKAMQAIKETGGAIDEAVLGAITGLGRALSPSAPATGGGTSVRQSSTVNVTVEGGVTNEATGGAVAAAVDAALEKRNRQAANAITVGP
jgi:hypothetical protein